MLGLEESEYKVANNGNLTLLDFHTEMVYFVTDIPYALRHRIAYREKDPIYANSIASMTEIWIQSGSVVLYKLSVIAHGKIENDCRRVPRWALSALLGPSLSIKININHFTWPITAPVFVYGSPGIKVLT